MKQDSYVGETARLKCYFYNWKKNWNMTWYLHGKAIPVRKHRRFRQKDGKKSLLRIRNVQMEDAGMYECVASSKYGRDSGSLNLIVSGK